MALSMEHTKVIARMLRDAVQRQEFRAVTAVCVLVDDDGNLAICATSDAPVRAVLQMALKVHGIAPSEHAMITLMDGEKEKN
jgi:hypothetical protein